MSLPWNVKNKMDNKDPGFTAVNQKRTYDMFDDVLKELGGFNKGPSDDFDKDLAALNPFMKKGTLKPYRGMTQVKNKKSEQNECFCKHFPEKKYSGSEKRGNKWGNTECAICLVEFSIGDAYRQVMACKHIFHGPC